MPKGKKRRDRTRAKAEARAKKRVEKRQRREAQSPALPPLPDRRAMEKTMRDITRLIETGGFDSIEEANAALAGRVLGRDIPEAQATTPLDQAQDLMYEAFDASGDRRAKLARAALEVCPDCADAYVLLAEETATSVEEVMDLLTKGVEAGKRALGEEAFEENVGHFWGVIETRPYMRARHGLAQCLLGIGEHEEAIGHFRELLRLNPNDNQGVRDLLLPLLLAMGRDEEAEGLIAQYEEDASAVFVYGRALLSFRQGGPSDEAQRRLGEALTCNPHLPDHLLGRKKPPRDLPDYYSPGDESEASAFAKNLTRAFDATPGALDWLAKATAEQE